MNISPYPSQARVSTVSEITRNIKGLLEKEFAFVAVVGEISNLRTPYSGHLYFTLKDSFAQIRMVLFKQQQRYLAKLPKEGDEVICWGRISLYESRGEYQILVDYLEHRQAGAIMIEFERLKKKLSDEGLFDQLLKKKLPVMPGRIALVTSPSGAALFDFLRVAEERLPSVRIDVYPVRVQGEGAAAEIVDALDDLNRRWPVEVIVLCRGGGSLEDLMPFNDEILARAIRASAIPVVTGVGHEIDLSIADLAADCRAATPTAAAEVVIPSRRELVKRLEDLAGRLRVTTHNRLADYRHRLKFQRQILADPRELITHLLQRQEMVARRILVAMTDTLRQRRDRLVGFEERLHYLNPAGKVAHQHQLLIRQYEKLKMVAGHDWQRRSDQFRQAVALLDAVSPLGILLRGYAIVTNCSGQKIVRNADQVQIQEELEIRLGEGGIRCRVLDVWKSTP